ncbi:MAG: hypothetical protein H0U71_05065 [Gammaproteobacteria bacterium]|nr:hypothetical protein [Gammaproteobacteria bacterium]
MKALLRVATKKESQQNDLYETILNNNNIAIKRHDESLISIDVLPRDILMQILVLLGIVDFYTTGRVSRYFFALVYSEEVMNLRSPGIIIFKINNQNKPISKIQNFEDTKNVLSSAKNHLFFKYIRWHDFPGFLDGRNINALELPQIMTLTISHKNFDAFKYFVEFLQKHMFQISGPGPADFLVNAAIFRLLKCLGLGMLRRNYKPLVEEKEKNKLCDALVSAGPQYIFEIITLFQYGELTLIQHNKYHLYQPETDFIKRTFRLKGKQGVKELLESRCGNYLSKIENYDIDNVISVPTSKYSEMGEPILQRLINLHPQSSDNDSNNEDVDLNKSSDIPAEVSKLKHELDKKDALLAEMSEKLNAAMKLISELQEENEKLKTEGAMSLSFK